MLPRATVSGDFLSGVIIPFKKNGCSRDAESVDQQKLVNVLIPEIQRVGVSSAGRHERAG